MKRSKRSLNLNSIACSADDCTSEVKKLKPLEDTPKEVDIDSQDHLQRPRKPIFMIDLNETDFSDDASSEDAKSYTVHDNGEDPKSSIVEDKGEDPKSYTVDDMGEHLTRAVKCESFDDQFDMNGNAIQEGSDESEVQIIGETSAVPIAPSVSLDVANELNDDGENALARIISIGEVLLSSMMSDPVLTQAQLVSNYPSCSSHDPPALLQFHFVSGTPGALKCKSPTLTAMTKSEEQGKFTERTSFDNLIDAQETVMEKFVNDLLSTADIEAGTSIASKPVTGLVNLNPYSKEACACVPGILASKPVTLPSPLRYVKPIMYQPSMPPNRIRCQASTATVFAKTSQPDIIDPVHALKWVTATPIIGSRVSHGNLYPMPFYSQAQISPSFPIPVYSIGANPVKDVHCMRNLGREHGEERQRFLNFQPAGSSGRCTYPWINQKLVREIRPKPPAPITPKSMYLKPCIFFNQQRGCRKGSECRYLHDMSIQWPPKELAELIQKSGKYHL